MICQNSSGPVGIRKLSGDGATLTLGTNIINASADACGLGVTPDLRLAKHASIVRGKCFFQLRQLWRDRRLLDADSGTTLIRAYITSRIDYCNCMFPGASKVWTDRLQRVLNAAARVLTETNKYDPRLTRILHSDLHWLDVPERIKYKLCLTVFKCFHGMASPLPLRTVHPSRTDQGTTSAALCSARSTRRSTDKTLDLRQARLRMRRTVCMELCSWLAQRKPILILVLLRTTLKAFLFSEYGTSKHYRDNLWQSAIVN